MQIDQHQQGAVTVLRPKGALTLDDADRFKACLHDAVSKNLGRVVLDASGVPFVDSRGLEVFVEMSELLANSGQALKLCHANETLREVLYLADITALFEYYEDVSSAVRSFL